LAEHCGTQAVRGDVTDAAPDQECSTMVEKHTLLGGLYRKVLVIR